MLPALLVAVAATAPAAPIPKDTLPGTTGPAPRVLAVRADAGGGIWITANLYSKQKVQHNIVAVENGKQVVKQQEVEQTTATQVHKSIGDFGGKFATADGTAITTEDATRRLKGGSTLLVTADGKPVDRGWLRAVAGDTVVMTAEGLGEAHFVHGYAPYPMSGSPRLVMLGTDDKGQVRLPVNPNGVNLNSGANYGNDFRAAQFRRRLVVQNGEIDLVESAAASGPSNTPPGPDGKKPLSDVDFEAYDTSGKLVSRADALDRLKAGGLVLIAGDNRFPDDNYLKAFRSDVIVLVSSELVFPPGTTNPYDRVGLKPDAGAVRPARAVPPANVGLAPVQLAKPVRVQVQVQIEK